MNITQRMMNAYINLVIDTLRRRLVMDEKWFELDSLTPSHDAKETKDDQLEVSQIQPGAPLDVVVD